MTPRARRAGSILLLVGLAVTLTACFGQWLTPLLTGKLIVGSPVPVDGRYEVLISVADMPDGGVAGIQLGTTTEPAITFSNNVDGATITAEGLSGFRVTAQSYTAGAPVEGYLIAVYGGVAIESGQALRLSFEATGVPTVTLDETRIWLTNDIPTWIAGWGLVTGAAYYTKEVGTP
ncbi:hypothetical protein ACFLS0_03535 [Candidatus Bipolaricaulota bacterium]